MKTIWIVFLDDSPDYASSDWYDVSDRYIVLVRGYGVERVKMRVGYVEED